MDKITVIEKDGLRAAWGEWNSPTDAIEGPMKDAWQWIESTIVGIPKDLKVGEWEAVDAATLPKEIQTKLKEAYEFAAKEMPKRIRRESGLPG